MKVLNMIIDCIAAWLCYFFVLILYAIVEPIQMAVTLFWYLVTPFKIVDIFYTAFQKIRNDKEEDPLKNITQVTEKGVE